MARKSLVCNQLLCFGQAGTVYHVVRTYKNIQSLRFLIIVHIFHQQGLCFCTKLLRDITNFKKGKYFLILHHSTVKEFLIDKDPTIYLSPEGGGVPQKDRIPLTDEQVEKLLQATKGLPPYLFVMLGLYAGLRREEILALKWDSVYLDLDAPYLTVRRAWHTENNRPVILTELKTNAAKRSIPLPPRLFEALKEAKESSTSDYVIANKNGQPLTYTQFKRLWSYITTRTAKPRKARKFVGGKYVKYTIYPVLGEKARNNGKVVYSLDFEVTPHQLRHTYITNLIYASVDPKTVQYLAGHENSKITMDIYAKAKYNRPKDVAPMLEHVFNQWNETTK